MNSCYQLISSFLFLIIDSIKLIIKGIFVLSKSFNIFVPISKINSALQRLKNGTYGFCEETGEPIGLKRLMARPVATLSIEAQEKHERMEKVHRED